MKRISLFPESKGPTRVLALGAHSDDIEIGCGGTLLRLVAERPELEVLWVVFCATGLFLLQFQARNRPATWPMVGLGLVVPLIVAMLFIH